MKHIGRLSVATGGSVVLLALATVPVLAHDQPDGANWLMADWMLLSWLAFFLAGIVSFVFALRRGLMANPEGQSKHFLLSIDEPDYYTPDWAREDEREDEEERDGSER